MRLLRVCLVLLAMAAVTGFGLLFFYVPAPGVPAAVPAGHQTISFGGVLRGIHFWTSQIVGPIVLLHLLASLTRRKPTGGKPKRVWAAGWLLLLLTAVLWFTGMLLPWDELSHWLIELGHGRGIHLTLLQIYWTHVALLPLATGAIAIYYVQGCKRGATLLAPAKTMG